MSIDQLPGPNERKQRKLANDGGPPYDETMLRRVEKLEQDVAVIKADLALIKATYATKSDVAEAKADIAEAKAATKADIAEARAATRVDIAEAKAAIILWVVTAVFLAQLLPSLLKIYLPPHIAP